MSGWYESLEAQDASFLSLGGETSPMHVGAVTIADAGPLSTLDGGLDVERSDQVARMGRRPYERIRGSACSHDSR